MTSEKTGEFRAPGNWLRVAVIVTLLAVILACIYADNSEFKSSLPAAVDTLARLLGLVVAVVGTAILTELRHARTADDVVRTVSMSVAVVLVGATLLAVSWSAPLGAGLVLGAIAIARRVRDASCGTGAEPPAKSAD
jgi:NADH:ubiquinone oxidoreductase subunit 2 (subunit N)